MEPAWFDNSSLGLRLGVCPIQFLGGAPIAHRELHTSPIHSTGMNSPIKEEAGLLEVRICQTSEENRKLSEAISAMCLSYDALKKKFVDFMSASPTEKGTISPTRKRKSESLEQIGHDDGPELNIDGFVNLLESASSEDSFKRLKEKSMVNISNVYVRTDPADKSLVQRNAEDGSILVATYEGEHNHSQNASQGEATTSLSPCGSVSINTSGPMITHDLTLPGTGQIVGKPCRPEMDSQLFQQLIVEKLTSSLTNDPSFTAAIATAISARFHQTTS